MTDYFSDNDAVYSNHPLPSPSDTPYHSLSRRTSRYGTPATDVSSSPAPFPPEPFEDADAANDEKISILDPRRFTPTLHASLVSEILNLRRELESRDKSIEELETSLHASREENDNLASELSATTKENRAVKRQLQQLENGTLSALEEIAGDRDKAKESNSDLKAKLESMQKKLRSQDEDSDRVHDMWAREKEAWAGEKRALERRVHISESRLKMVLEELAMQESARQEAAFDSETEEVPRDSGVGHDSDTASVRSSPQRRPSTRIARHSRNISNGSFRSIGRNYRMSYMSGTGSEGQGRMNGISLADELIFDEEEEDLGELELDSDDFPENEMRARRAMESRQSMCPDEKAKRILGLNLESQQTSDAQPTVEEVEEPYGNGTSRLSRAVVTPDIQLIFPPPRPIYVDTGVQFSPPPSPVREQCTPDIEPPTIPPKSPERMSPAIEVEANQSRKRISVPSSSPADAVTAPTTSQNTDQPPSPPATPTVISHTSNSPEPPAPKPELVSVSTQTEPIQQPETKSADSKRAPPPAPIIIPSIAIHAPSSAPPSPKEPVLPPGTKSIATQTSGDLPSDMRSVSTQTDPIRINERLKKLPAHLLPSAIRSRPGTPEPSAEGKTAALVTRKDSHQPVSQSRGKEKAVAGPSARQDLMKLLQNDSERDIEDWYPGNNDNGPLARDKDSILSRPFRTSSLFAGFDGPSSDEEDNAGELSDDDFRIPQYSGGMMSSRNVKSGRIFANPPTPVPEDKEVNSTHRPSEDSFVSGRNSSNRSSFEKSSRIAKSRGSNLIRQPSIRRSAMITSGTTAHMRARSPSLSSVGSTYMVQKPPFPVPTRSSSRTVGLSKSEGSQSPTPRSSGAFSGRRPYGTRQHQRKDSLRKVQSAAVIQKRRARSRSPPLPEPPVMPPSPELPPLPTDSVTGHMLGHRSQLSTQTAQTTYTASGSVGSSSYQTSVVDAIAATMVGEWMWKYVRKRKAFGGPESPADLARAEESASSASNGVRHKRWVWISPYERSVLWSSKQPTTSSALIGKSGRKLTIQSVLDVADNTPIPRNAGAQPLFNRSILILTPARALKFTAVSRERHYLWLTALSFLAHSNSPIPDLAPAPPVPPPVEESTYKPIGATLRRSHVRDSVRLAKGKVNPVKQRAMARADPMPELFSLSEHDRPVPDAADPPSIPRGPNHGRKRSSTGPGAPPPSVPFRSFSAQQVPSLYSSGSSDVYNMQPPSVPSSVYNPQSVIASTRTSEASSAARQHFFDSMGTVRMEAFIDNSLNDRGAVNGRPRMGRVRRNSQWSASTNEARGIADLQEEFVLERGDPFRGF